jgi:prevent-host-death family protein
MADKTRTISSTEFRRNIGGMTGSPETIAMTDFARNYGAVFERVANGKETITLLTHGRPRVVCVPVDEYDALMEARRQLAWTRLAMLVDPPKESGTP